MFDSGMTLAQSSITSYESSPSALVKAMMDNKWDLLNRPHELTDAVGQLGLVWAIIFIVLGGICVFSGYRWHKAVIFVLALFAGGIAGRLIGIQIGVADIVTCVAGACLFAVLAWPILRYTVALFAGLAGAFAGANIWTAVGQPQDQHYIGAMIGLLVLGMLAFITFRIVIIAFTAIGGASILVVGSLAVLLNTSGWEDNIQRAVVENPLVIPIITASAAIIGIIFQQGGGMKGLLESADRAAQDGKGGKAKSPAAAA